MGMYSWRSLIISEDYNSQAAYNFCIDSDSKIYKIYWNKLYIIFYADNLDKYNITYAIFDKDVFENQIYTDNI